MCRFCQPILFIYPLHLLTLYWYTRHRCGWQIRCLLIVYWMRVSLSMCVQCKWWKSPEEKRNTFFEKMFRFHWKNSCGQYVTQYWTVTYSWNRSFIKPQSQNGFGKMCHIYFGYLWSSSKFKSFISLLNSIRKEMSKFLEEVLRGSDNFPIYNILSSTHIQNGVANIRAIKLFC